MTEAPPRRYTAGETALVIKVPDVEPFVDRWRQRFDPAARAGVPAHITVLYPFLHQSRVDSDLLHTLGQLLSEHPAPEVHFQSCGRFPGVLYLAPTPPEPLRALTEAVVEQWPEAPPYGGQFPEIVPHLTIADGQPPPVLDEIEADLAHHLPITTQTTSIDLVVTDGTRWHGHTSFPLLD
jgi:2'-5' RNA ligase